MAGSTRELLQTDLTSWEIGPYHGSLPGPMRLRLKLDGEIMVHGSVETGFLHRGLEKSFELHSWQSATAYADHLDPENAVFGEFALCLAVESIGKIPVPARAQCIRIILSELTRVSSHLGFIARMAKVVSSESTVHFVLRDREKILDLFELLTGARFSLNFLRYGGVASDVTEGFVERVLEVCDLIRIRLKEYNDIFSFNDAFLRRTSFIGVTPTGNVLKYGVTGPNARSAGLAFDVRKAHPYSGYEQVDFESPVGTGEGGTIGDAHDRFVLRLREISQSLEILKQLVDNIPGGEFHTLTVDREFKVPAGEAYSRIESSRGLLGCHVVSDGGEKPCRIQFRAPSSASLMLLPDLIVGSKLEDLPVILSSLDIGMAEVDR
jgi:NADH-quinone oxidoreductase subunit D